MRKLFLKACTNSFSSPIILHANFLLIPSPCPTTSRLDLEISLRERKKNQKGILIFLGGNNQSSESYTGLLQVISSKVA